MDSLLERAHSIAMRYSSRVFEQTAESEWRALALDAIEAVRRLSALPPSRPAEPTPEIHPAEFPLAYAAQLRAKLANSEGDVTMGRAVLAESAECLEGRGTGRRYNVGVLDKP